jgi:ABC-type antimicrobial peptide transport system permease subunit
MLAYAIVKRRKEIGIRIALGANRNSVVRAVLTRVLAILSIGAITGAVIAAGTGPLISSVVLGVSPREPLLLAGIIAVLALITFIACTGPIRKSLALDPLIALRDE